ncbi:MAG TPA: hypothetical protein VFJ49_04740 [Methyloceanibacter sp.]|nr:hypothetical protein [Methyloceanibacter sp.]
MQQYLTPPHVAGENTQMRLVTDIHAHQHLTHDAVKREHFLERRERGKDRP